MLLTGDGNVGPERRLEQFELRPAEALAGCRSGADRTVVFDQQKAAVFLRLDLGHVALAGSETGQEADAIAEVRMRLQGPAVARRHLLLPQLDKAIEARGAKHRPDAVDQADGQIAMRIGKPGVALCRQPPNPFRAADLAGPVIERDKTVAPDLRQVLAHADLGDPEDGRQVARTEGAARF